MKKTVLIFALMLPGLLASAQFPYDSLAVGAAPQVDSSLLDVNIMDTMPSCVKVIQSSSTSEGLQAHIRKNESKMYVGFRIRIYFESDRDARSGALNASERFKMLFYGIPVYLTYGNPYFSVSVGDYRNRVDAEAALESIKEFFPGASIVRERFKYPAIR